MCGLQYPRLELTFRSMRSIGGYATEDASPRSSALVCVSTQEEARLYEPPLPLPRQGGRLNLVEIWCRKLHLLCIRSKGEQIHYSRK